MQIGVNNLGHIEQVHTIDDPSLTVFDVDRERVFGSLSDREILYRRYVQKVNGYEVGIYLSQDAIALAEQQAVVSATLLQLAVLPLLATPETMDAAVDLIAPVVATISTPWMADRHYHAGHVVCDEVGCCFLVTEAHVSSAELPPGDELMLANEVQLSAGGLLQQEGELLLAGDSVKASLDGEKGKAPALQVAAAGQRYRRIG